MAPIKVGFVGLSSTGGAFGGGSWAAGAHLPYFRKTSNYKITALQNSSKASAEKSARDHELGDQVATYGDAKSIAQDPNVSLVAVSVKVPHHYEILKPALEAGKDVFVEWPLAANLAEATELTALARAKGAKTFVGLQARQDPAIRKARSLVASGELGKILGTTLTGNARSFGTTVPESIKYGFDIKSGASLITIPFGHSIDALCFVLGEWSSLQATLAINNPTVTLVDDADHSKVLDPKYPNTAHDWVTVTGTLVSGGVATVTYTPGALPTGRPFYWEIIGSKAALVIEGPGHVQLAHPTLKIVRAGGEMETISVDTPDSLSYNLGSAWDAFAGKSDAPVTTFEDGLLRHKMIDAIYRSHEKGTRESYL